MPLEVLDIEGSGANGVVFFMGSLASVNFQLFQHENHPGKDKLRIKSRWINC